VTVTPSPHPPLLSVIIPTYNRPAPLTACLNALARVDYPRDRFEVLVVDDGGDMSPAATVDEFRERLTVELLSPPHGGPAKARNFAAERAKGDFLVFVDDDCLVAPDFLERLAAQLGASPRACIGGRTVNALTNNVYSSASQAVMEYLSAALDGRGRSGRFFCSNNVSFPTEMFRAIGGFDETMMTGEDRDICDRWSSRGFVLRYCPDVRVRHAHALTLTSFWGQHFNYGRGSFRFRRSSARRHGRTLALENLPFYVNLLRYRGAEIGGAGAVRIGLLLALSQAATAMGFATEAVADWRRRAR
jgi:GT2 family glycosyltransferase